EGGGTTTPPVTQPPPSGASANASTCAVGASCSLTDANGAVWTFGAAVDARGNAVLKNTQPTNGVAMLILYCTSANATYGKTNAGNYWQIGAPADAGIPKGLTPPCS